MHSGQSCKVHRVTYIPLQNFWGSAAAYGPPCTRVGYPAADSSVHRIHQMMPVEKAAIKHLRGHVKASSLSQFCGSMQR